MGDAAGAASAWLTVSPMSFVVAPGATQVVTATIKTPAKPDLGLARQLSRFDWFGSVELLRYLGSMLVCWLPGGVAASALSGDLDEALRPDHSGWACRRRDADESEHCTQALCGIGPVSLQTVGAGPAGDGADCDGDDDGVIGQPKVVSRTAGNGADPVPGWGTGSALRGFPLWWGYG